MQNKKISPILIYGLLGGLMAEVFLFAMWQINPSIVTSFSIMIIEVGVTVIFMLLGVIAERKANYNYIEFKQALKVSYGTAVIAWAFFCVGFLLLYKFIDPSLVKLYFENMAAQGKAHGISDQEIARVIAEKQQAEFPFSSPKTMVFIYFFLTILSFFYALLISGLFALASKDNKPADNITGQFEASN